ncbi:bifunctional histidinol-phosphatase/imidazoleglycerol-phosphate dehydratase HisB [Myroides indicus]|uniref:Histidine biosynthesis bifunctional protein HisB n=1 Tax=Myroides indicus TaxID=1323422 RepID=A0A4R7EX67_9FLAO|nr:bifunctional histidinol-phosphatase/imidazoleglycerol-phosphate dehydratase HisB [Myroides indicus]TDS56916.1 imidazoleglycerol-phosphate dehydratase [Myroides indicus]
MNKKVLFIDRDGTIIKEPSDFQIDSFDKLEFLQDVITSLSKITKELDYELVLVTNQDGLGTKSFPEETFWPVQSLMLDILKSQGVIFNEIYIDKSFQEEQKPTRKPGVAMLTKFMHGNYDLGNSFVIGDRVTDIQLAKNLGSGSILIREDAHNEADLVTSNWNEIYNFLKRRPRVGKSLRKTNETEIKVEVNLDSDQLCAIQTGLHFFDHMLEQLNRHGRLGLSIHVIGDLHIDEHHTIEDTALVLGNAFKIALGSKKGIERYGYTLPMDDCLAQVVIDFGGRPWIVWDVAFKREKIGDVPTEMFYHFFKSFSDAAQCNLNIQCQGENEHHKIESIFKAFAKAIRKSITLTDTYDIPSTKGVI